MEWLKPDHVLEFIKTGDLSSIKNLVTSTPVILMILGYILYILKSLPLKVIRTIWSLSTISLSATSMDGNYQKLSGLFERYKIPFLSRNIRLRYNRSGKPTLVLGYGRGISLLPGGLLVIHHTSYREHGSNEVDDVTAVFLSRNATRVLKVIDDYIFLNNTDTIKIIRVARNQWMPAVYRPKRSLDTVHIPNEDKINLVNSIQSFLDSENVYNSRGEPYKKVILLDGPPGTGKTSLIQAVASHFDFSIHLYSTIESLEDVNRQFRRSLVVLEDIDALFGESVSSRELSNSKSESAGRNFSDFLNITDGLSSPHGMIMIMTTNYAERLDPALLRPGRTDLRITIGKLRVIDACNMFDQFYGKNAATQFNLCQIFNDSQSSLTGAELQSLLRTSATPAIAVDKISNYMGI